MDTCPCNSMDTCPCNSMDKCPCTILSSHFPPGQGVQILQVFSMDAFSMDIFQSFSTWTRSPNTPGFFHGHFFHGFPWYIHGVPWKFYSRVSFPVKVFCWLGWYDPTRVTFQGNRTVFPCEKVGLGLTATYPSSRQDLKYASNAIFPNATTTLIRGRP